MMNKVNFRCLFLCILCTICYFMTFCSCKSEYIEVCYYRYGCEIPISIPPDSFQRDFINCKADTLYISKEIFDSIWNGFKATKVKTETKWDTRFWVKLDNKQYFMDNFYHTYNKNYESVALSHRIIYLIKKAIGYYNDIPKEDMDSEHDIKEFGIPKDYHYSVPDSPDPLPGEPPRKPLVMPIYKKVRLFKQE